MLIDKLVLADWNYKKDYDDPDVVERMKKLRENVKRNGQVVNLVVRELNTGFFEVLDGNHRLQVVRDLGLKKVHVYNMGKIPDAKAQRLSLEINENTFDKDPLKMGRLLAALNETETFADLSETLPWREEEILNFAKMTEFNWSDHEYDPKKKPSANKKDSEDFAEVRLPSSLVGMFEGQMSRARSIIRETVDPSITDDEIIRPFEMIIGFFATAEDDTIKANYSGEGGI